jgi:hypothetical protein
MKQRELWDDAGQITDNPGRRYHPSPREGKPDLLFSLLFHNFGLVQ